MINNTMRITGFASGLDTNAIIRDLMKAERFPLDKLFQKKEWLSWQRDAYRDVNLELSAFQKKVDQLRFSSSFNGYKATSTNTANALASAKGNAIQGSYELEINQLAEVAKIKSGSAIINVDDKAAKGIDNVLPQNQGDSTFEIKTANGTATITVTENDTFSSVASKIGVATDPSGKSLGLRAFFDETTTSFVITTKDMGKDQSIELTHMTGATDVASLIFNGSSPTNPSSPPFKAEGRNAEITFDGTVINNLPSNKVTVYGIDLTLLKVGTTTTVNVESDTESIFNNIKDFVESYNSLIDSLNSKVKAPRNRDYQPLTAEQRESLSEKEAEKWDEKAKQGLLYNDQIIRNTLTNLRGKMYNAVSGIPSGQLKLLSEIGIKSAFMSADGKLEIDEDMLKAAIANNPNEVEKLFTSDDGIATRIYDEVGKSIESLNKKAGRPNTAINLDISSLGGSIKEVSTQMKTWEDKLKLIENRYWRQFTAMEQAINKMNAQSSSILGMIG
ncbi:flagellar filament capping protein FliD [Cytobacillus depressus]|uniref:Flagellar hook-associated protein 2 n=1 Tax=Cytobacillus depressus TaxID=1602942 RepID=A0A6L3V6C7_9BACI|nr:flagellar filament capping protein FliD [Cytobacillus depressus]KAB2336794.1 flagellar filament capping protein FliD [Cytobacillus depressus]